MGYSKSLVARVEHALAHRRGIARRQMFGGMAFLLHGNMLVGVWDDSLLARVGPAQYAEALALPDVGEFEVAGKPMTGWVLVSPEGIDGDRQLAQWIERAEAFVITLPWK